MFKVCKRDGCWWVLDRRGRLRYAAGSHRMALTFALIQAHHFPIVKGEIDPDAKRMHFDDSRVMDAVRRLRQQREDVRRALESALESDPDEGDADD